MLFSADCAAEEICGLHWRDVDFERRVIHVGHSASYTDGLKAPKTQAGIRSVGMIGPIADALNKLYASRAGTLNGATDRVLVTRNGKPINPLGLYGDHWRPVLIKAGIISKDEPSPFRFHSLPHAAVSLLIEKGLSPLHIKGMIGHASVTTTLDVYGHLFPTDEAVKRASEAIVLDLGATRMQLAPLTH